MGRRIEEYEKGLGIRGDELNQCLVEQPEFYYHVADEAEAWVSTRDTIKYNIDKLEAQLEVQFRREAGLKGDKLTDKAVTAAIAAHPDVIDQNEKLLDAKSELGRWSSLRDSYTQRSKMMDLIVHRELRLLSDLSMERGTAITRSNLTEARSEQVQEMRRKKLSAE